MRLNDDGVANSPPILRRHRTDRWTGATASELLIKLIRFYHGACERAVARSTPPFDAIFFALGPIRCINEVSFSIFVDTAFRLLQRVYFMACTFARSTINPETAWSEVSAVRNNGTVRFEQERAENSSRD